MRRLLSLGLVLLSLAVLAGCGQKGPLYLPGDEEAAETYDPTGEAYESEPEVDQDNDTDAADGDADDGTDASGSEG